MSVSLNYICNGDGAKACGVNDMLFQRVIIAQDPLNLPIISEVLGVELHLPCQEMLAFL